MPGSMVLNYFAGDLKSGRNVMNWLLDSETWRLPLGIEDVNDKMLSTYLERTSHLVVFFCESKLS